MGFFNDFINPFEKSYNPAVFLKYGVAYIDAYKYAEKHFPLILNSVPRRHYAVLYTTVFNRLHELPYKKGELALQVLKIVCEASYIANRNKRRLKAEDLLLGPAQTHGYCTELIMRHRFVTPAKASILDVYQRCWRHIVKSEGYAAALAAIYEKTGEENQSEEQSAVPEDVLLFGNPCQYAMDKIGETHFLNEMWSKTIGKIEEILSGNRVWYPANDS